MTKEFRWKSKTGKSFFHAGFGAQDAVGAERPSDAVPLNDGARLLFAKGIDGIWAVMLLSAALRQLLHPHRRRCRRR